MSKTRPTVVTATRKPNGWKVTVLPKDRRSKLKTIGVYESVEDTANEMVEQVVPSTDG